MSKTKGTEYYGFENVPSGVLVRAKARGHFQEGVYLFLLKPNIDDGTFSAFFAEGDGGRFHEGNTWNPDNWTVGVYKALN